LGILIRANKIVIKSKLEVKEEMKIKIFYLFNKISLAPLSKFRDIEWLEAVFLTI